MSPKSDPARAPAIRPAPGDPDAFERAVLADCRRRGWDPAGASLLLCVSGGADSMALLHCFGRLAPELGLRLSAVHVDHRLREESAEDAAFAARAAAAHGVPLTVCVLDPGGRGAGESIEMWGRRERYARFEAAAHAAAADYVATAHHRDDQVETVFQRLGRGTGFRGLAGIPFRRGNIVRPFLGLSRDAIRAYLEGLGVSWRDDSSNLDVTFGRNWYRHRFLPAMRAESPDLDARVAALAETAARLAPWAESLRAGESLLGEDAAGIPSLDARAVGRLIDSGDGDGLRYWLQALADAARAGAHPSVVVTPAILDEFLRQWEARADKPSTGRSGNLRVGLSPEYALVLEKGAIFCRGPDFPPGNGSFVPKKSCSPDIRWDILGEGPLRAEWRWGGRTYSLTARRYPRPVNLGYPATSEERAIFDADRISCTLLVRIRKDGDRFSPLGVQSRSRKLKKFFNEEKVPADLRDSLPIVVSCHPSRAAGTTADGESPVNSGSPGSPGGDAEPLEGEIPAWIPGYGISDFYKVRGGTTHILELVMRCENP